MQISSRFTLAIHIIACIETFKNEYKVTSAFRHSYRPASDDGFFGRSGE